MKQQDLKALTKVAIERADASREAPGAQLTLEQIEQVSGGVNISSRLERIPCRTDLIEEDLIILD